MGVPGAFGALWECLCEEGETDADAQAHFDVLEQRTLDVFHHQRQAVLTALVQVMLVFNLLPILIHIAICRCRRRRTKVDPRKPEKASTDDGIAVAGNSSTPHAEPLDAPNDRSNSPRDDVTMDAELLQRQIARVTESARRQREFVGAIFIHFGWVFWVLIFFSFLCGGISGMAATPIMGHRGLRLVLAVRLVVHDPLDLADRPHLDQRGVQHELFLTFLLWR